MFHLLALLKRTCFEKVNSHCMEIALLNERMYWLKIIVCVIFKWCLETRRTFLFCLPHFKKKLKLKRLFWMIFFSYVAERNREKTVMCSLKLWCYSSARKEKWSCLRRRYFPNKFIILMLCQEPFPRRVIFWQRILNNPTNLINRNKST